MLKRVVVILALGGTVAPSFAGAQSFDEVMSRIEGEPVSQDAAQLLLELDRASSATILAEHDRARRACARAKLYYLLGRIDDMQGEHCQQLDGLKAQAREENQGVLRLQVPPGTASITLSGEAVAFHSKKAAEPSGGFAVYLRNEQASSPSEITVAVAIGKRFTVVYDLYDQRIMGSGIARSSTPVMAPRELQPRAPVALDRFELEIAGVRLPAQAAIAAPKGAFELTVHYDERSWALAIEESQGEAVVARVVRLEYPDDVGLEVHSDGIALAGHEAVISPGTVSLSVAVGEQTWPVTIDPGVQDPVLLARELRVENAPSGLQVEPVGCPHARPSEDRLVLSPECTQVSLSLAGETRLHDLVGSRDSIDADEVFVVGPPSSEPGGGWELAPHADATWEGDGGMGARLQVDYRAQLAPFLLQLGAAFSLAGALQPGFGVDAGGGVIALDWLQVMLSVGVVGLRVSPESLELGDRPAELAVGLRIALELSFVLDDRLRLPVHVGGYSFPADPLQDALDTEFWMAGAGLAWRFAR